MVQTFKIFLVLTAGFISAQAWGAPKKNSSSMAISQSSSSKSTGKDWLITLPVMSEMPQLRLHTEYNIERSLGLAIEAGVFGKNEEVGIEEQKTTGNSMVVNGVHGALLMSRYSDEAYMGGFFWTVGAGYRKWSADWKNKANPDEKNRMSLVDNEGYLHHRVDGEGVTGHLRAGYRYVAHEWPFAIGLHIGMRHMNSRIKDVEAKEGKGDTSLTYQYSPVSDKERKQLKNKMMTTPDISVDVGLAF